MPDLPFDSKIAVDSVTESDSKDIFILENYAKRTEVTQRGGGGIVSVVIIAIMLLAYSFFVNEFPILRTILIVFFLLLLVYLIIARFTNIISESMHFILSKQLFSPFHYIILKYRYHVISHKTLRQKTFAPYNEVNQSFFILLLKYLANNPSYLHQLGPKVQQLIIRCKEKNYDLSALNDVFDYYTYTTEELLNQYLNHHPVSANRRERIIYEADMTDRHLLERELPVSDPLLKEIYDHDHIGLTNGFGILK
ncbi:hypothetical protein NEF87_000033 [Candidatus Lokiarchaeum ossiferum]|uniref:Peptidase M48 domain-containing protein n=1 Tax=Candidatus Lokiarchaeum ossiferum TaxID=2951803 RepID=A0ABY6HJQ6_9ARCH|nr:hypothetical protein NEF87_000033 [Candidatus Lokiarchaeum sp. B-35]